MLYHTTPFTESSQKTQPYPQKHACDAYLRVDINYTELFGIEKGVFSWNKVSTLAFFNATEAGRLLWDTLYDVAYLLSISRGRHFWRTFELSEDSEQFTRLKDLLYPIALSDTNQPMVSRVEKSILIHHQLF